ncbi:MAG: InlB B-repeat-containing protein, partial [Lachnospiraceae bacterium]|nr:InlB B-repeat-containing protein [Lachnospiraceae bacterium]
PTPVRSRYIFKGWSDSANGTVKFAPGAKYTENADATLYAIWEKYFVSVNRPKVTFDENGNRNVAPQTVLLMSNYSGSFYAWVKETIGGDDWLEVQVEGNTLKIWADANLSGTGTRKAIISVSNDSEAGCTVEVEQKGNYIQLKDETGKILESGENQQIWFDETGKYNDDGMPFFYVKTLIDSYTCAVEYDEGTEGFLTVNTLGNQVIIKCQPNQGYERAATLVVTSGAVVERYRIVQQVKQVFVTYQQVRGQQIESVTVQQDYGSKILRQNSEMLIPESYVIDGVVTPFVGWRTPDNVFVAQGEKVYEDTTVLAVYSTMRLYVTDKNKQMVLDVKALRCDYQGNIQNVRLDDLRDEEMRAALRKQLNEAHLGTVTDEIFGNWEKAYAVYYEFPIRTNGEPPFIWKNDNSFSLELEEYGLSHNRIRRTSGEEYSDPNHEDRAMIWVYGLKVSDYVGETVVNDKGKEVFAPYEQSRGAVLRLSDQSGELLAATLIQSGPSIEHHGWNEGLMYYGITKEQFYDVRYTGGATPIQGCSVNVSHSITKGSDGVFTNKSTFQISYTGEGSFVAIGEQDKVYSYYVKDLVLEKFRIACEHFTLCALAEGEVSYTNGIDKIVESLGESFGKAWTTITFLWDEYIDKSPAAKFIDRLQVLVDVATIPIDAFLDFKLAGVRDTKEYWANVANAFINTYELYWTNSDGMIETKIDSGFLYSVRNGKVADAQKCNGSHTFDENEMVIIGKLESE